MSEIGPSAVAAAAAAHSDLPPPPEQLDVTSGPIKVEVALPSGEIVSLTVDKSTPVMDFIVQLTRAHKLNTTDHILNVLSEETGRPVDYASGQLIGQLLLLRGRKRLSLLSKAELKKKQERKATEYRSAAKFETTHRVLVNLPRGVKAVYRMRLDLPVGEAFRTTCADKGLDPARHFVSLPSAPAAAIDLATPLAACGKNEICIVERTPPPTRANGGTGPAVSGLRSAQAVQDDVPQKTAAARLPQLITSHGEAMKAPLSGGVVNRPVAGSAPPQLSQSAPASPQISLTPRPSPPGAKPSRKKYAAPPPPPPAALSGTAFAVATPSTPANSAPTTTPSHRPSQADAQPAAAARAGTESPGKDDRCRGTVVSFSDDCSGSRSSGPDGQCESSGGSGGSLLRHHSSDASSGSDTGSLSSSAGATDSSAELCNEPMPPPPPPLPAALINAAAEVGYELNVGAPPPEPGVDCDAEELAGEAPYATAGRKASTGSASSRKSAKQRAPSLPLRPPSPDVEISAL